MMKTAIETVNIIKDFDGDRAVDNLSLAVPEGSVFGLMGPNGAGKSTLIRMLMGIYRPSSGTGSILGKDIMDPSGRVREEVGYVADFQNMYPFFRVEDILQFGAKVYPNWDWDRAHKLMKTFELPSRKWVRALSKGMKTQLALIMALSIRPRVLILDEPTSGLDPVIKHHFLQLIMQEAASGDTTVFFSTHNLNDLERMADQVAVITKGKLIFNKAIEELKASARKIQVVFTDELPEVIRNMPEILHIENQGKLHSLVVGDRLSEVMKTINSLTPVYMETMDIGLEELFIHTMGKEGYGHESIILE